MKKILITICLIGGLAMLWSCSDDKDSYPVPSDIENLKRLPLRDRLPNLDQPCR